MKTVSRHVERFPLERADDRTELGLDALWWDIEALKRSWPKARRKVASLTGEDGRITALPCRMYGLWEHVAAISLAVTEEEREQALDAMDEWLTR